MEHGYLGAHIDGIVVDEVQDFTQVDTHDAGTCLGKRTMRGMLSWLMFVCLAIGNWTG